MAIVIESEKSGRYIPILERYFLFRIYFFILLRYDAENKQNLSPKFFFTKILALHRHIVTAES